MGRSFLILSSVRRGVNRYVLGLVILAAGSATPVKADISFLDMTRNDAYLQTGNGNSLSFTGSFFSVDLNSVNPGDYNAVQLSYPGAGSPQDLTQTSPSTFSFQTGLFPSQAAMDSAYPTGTYTFLASNPSTTDTASLTYSKPDFYSQSLPFLAGTNFTALQGVDAHAAFTFQFSPFVTGTLPPGGSSFIFLTVFDTTTNTTVFTQGFLPSTTTSVIMPANTLTPGDSYSSELIFDNRYSVPSPGAEFDAPILFDVRSDVSFTASSVPEPATMALFAPACAFLVWMGVRRRTN
jgi:hypothetical protein